MTKLWTTVRSRLRLADGEAGQTLVLGVMFMTVMLGFAALVIDGGNYLLQRRNLQGVADAGALAGVRSLPDSESDARNQAYEYVVTENSGDQAIVSGAGGITVTMTGSGSCDTADGTVSLGPMSVCVTVERQVTGYFTGMFTSDSGDNLNTALVRASAIARLQQVRAIGGWLPIGMTVEAAVSGEQVLIMPGSKEASPGGYINTPSGDSCTLSGKAGIDDTILGEANGGEDACPIDIVDGQEILTQTGVSGQPTTMAFEDRIGSNTQALEDVFGKDIDGNWYVKDPYSPRLGVVPLAQDTNGEWPLDGNASIDVKGYMLVYIGRTSTPDSTSLCGPPDPNSYPCPATTGQGSPTFTIYLTPIDAPLPDEWDATLGDYDPTNKSPIVYTMTS